MVEPEELPEPVVGWVVGVRWLQSGETVWDPEYGNLWESSGSVRAVLVSKWPTRKPLMVPVDAYTLGGTPTPALPAWKAEHREMMRLEMANHPRDASGRWLPGG